MRTLYLLPLLASIAAGCGNGSNGNGNGNDGGGSDGGGTPDLGVTRQLILFHTNDEHSHLNGDAPELDDFPPPATAGTGTIQGGIGRRAVVLKQERDAAKQKGIDTLTVSGGDNSQSTLAQVPFATKAPDYTLMKAIGYDVTTFGNHEFDQRPPGLASAINYAVAHGGIPQIVATNIQFSSTDPGDDALAALFDESGTDMTKPVHRTLLVTTPSGIKVGFVGYLGVIAATYAPFKTPVTFSLPAGVMETEFDKVKQQLYADLQKGVDHLRNDLKADVVIALSHAGVNTTDMTKGEDYQVAQNVTGINVIVSGHTHTLFPIVAVTNPKSNKPVYIQQANYYGYHLGKIALSIGADGNVTADMSASKLIPIDDTIVASDANINSAVSDVIKGLEADKVVMGTKSFLENTLSNIEGGAVVDDPNKVGDLYFRPVGKTGFDIAGKKNFTETPLAVLVADAELAAADRYSTDPTDFSLTVHGVIRANIAQGKTGQISFNDVFNVLPLGVSAADGSIGYPMSRFYVYAYEVKAALEISTGYAYTSEDTSTYYMTTGGLKVEYDTSRPIFDTTVPKVFDPTNGRITKITMATSHAQPVVFDKVIFDLSAASPGWQNGIVATNTLFAVATSSYIAAYANVQGVQLKDKSGNPLMLAQTILKRPAGGSEVKEWEALAEYIRAFPGGTVPAGYNTTTPTRLICSGPLCVK